MSDKCKTCGGSGEIAFCPPMKMSGSVSSVPDILHKPCPDCQKEEYEIDEEWMNAPMGPPKKDCQKGELVHKPLIERFDHYVQARANGIYNDRDLVTKARQLLEQAADRIEVLEKALEKHKHTDECLAYAAKTSKASGVFHCIAKCYFPHKAALGEKALKK